MKRYQNRHSGFTLVELLVVIAIIGVLIALLLPAVQAAREAARRSQCTNNLKQIGLAMHNYHDINKSLPSGWVDNGTADVNLLGWGVMILPQLELTNLHSKIKEVGAFDAKWSSIADMTTATSTLPTPYARTVLPAFICPSDPSDGINSDLSDYGKSNYTGIGGNAYISSGTTTPTGTFYDNSKVAFRDITDGLSNTVIIGERSTVKQTGYVKNGTIWIGGPSDGTYYYNNAIVSNSTYYSINGAAGSYNLTSAHPTGVIFLKGDGSVEFISETIDLPTYQNLGAISDGNVIGEY